LTRWNELRALVGSLDLGEPGSARRPPRDDVRTLQNALGASLADEDFCLEVMELELDASLGAEKRPGGPVSAPPFHEIRGRGIFFRLFYWPPGKEAPPHEHTSWTVTAVFHNTLTVTTYDWETAVREQRLAERNTFSAERGRAGHIYDDSIHRPSNPTDRLAASIHIFNSNDGPVLRDRVGPIEGLADDMGSMRWPGDADAFARATGGWRQRLLLMHADMLAGFRSPRALALLERIWRLGDPLVKFVVAMIMKRIDAARGQTLLRDLYEIAPEFAARETLVTLRA